MVKFDSYCGPAFHENGSIPITPLCHTWITNGISCSHLKIPLKLAWAITIHKSQGLTLDRAAIDVGKKEFSTGLTFVACSRVRKISDFVFINPFDYSRLSNLSKSKCLMERRSEDLRLRLMEQCTFPTPPAALSLPIPATESSNSTIDFVPLSLLGYDTSDEHVTPTPPIHTPLTHHSSKSKSPTPPIPTPPTHCGSKSPTFIPTSPSSKSNTPTPPTTHISSKSNSPTTSPTSKSNSPTPPWPCSSPNTCTPSPHSNFSNTSTPDQTPPSFPYLKIEEFDMLYPFSNTLSPPACSDN